MIISATSKVTIVQQAHNISALWEQDDMYHSIARNACVKQEFMKGVCRDIKRISAIDFMGEIIDVGQPLRLRLIGKQLIRVLCDFWICFDGLFNCFLEIF